MSFSVGEVLLGKLRVTRELGRGGMGQVFEVVHELTQHRRALKVIHPRLRTDDELVQRFLREASAAGRIGNRHIAETFDAGFLPDGTAYLLMELLTGSPLSAYLAAAGQLPVGEAAAIALQCCEALQAAHEARIVHRDVKPDNLFLVETEPVFVKVLDFGIAHFEASPEAPGAILGTPLYMAPEQFLGTGSDARTDLYALGVVLYELLAGKLPWAKEPLAMISVLACEGRLPRLSTVRPEVPDALAAVVERCMAVDPKDRFQDALQLRAALEPLARRSSQPRAEEPEPTSGDTLVRGGPASVLSRPAARVFSVPRPTDRFVGRVAERQRLQRDLAGQLRLVVIVGPAGAGKTRLAVETLWTVEERSAAFVDVSGVTDVDGLCTAVARALAIPVGDARIDLSSAVGASLGERPDFILALDNVEQALPAVESVLLGWLAAAPRLCILATSRLRFTCREATHHEVGPLGEATELLVERVRALRGSFDPSPADASALEEIAGQADSLPLAVELLASRMLVLTPVQLLDRMRSHQTPTERRGPGLDRRSTLRDALDSSWRLLNAAEQTALAQFSTFHGGCTLSAAERVLELPAGISALEVTESLVARSLMSSVSSSGAEPRLVLLNTVHDYAQHELARQGEEAAASTRLRHAREYARLSELVCDPQVPADSQPVLATLQRELGNLSASLDWASTLETAEGRTLAASLAIAVDPLLAMRGNYEKRVGTLERLLLRLEGVPPGIATELHLILAYALFNRDQIARAQHLLTSVGAPSDDLRRGRWFLLRGVIAHRQGNHDEAPMLLNTALSCARACGSRWLAGRALVQQGNAAGDARSSLRNQTAALPDLIASNDRRAEGMARSNIGSAHSDLREVLLARESLIAAFKIHEEIGSRRSAGVTLTNLGILSLDEGAMAEAEDLLVRSLSIHREVGNRRHLAITLVRLSGSAFLRGELATARSYGKEAADHFSAIEDLPNQAASLASLAFVACAEGEVAEAADHVARATALLPRNSPAPAAGLVVLAGAGPAAARGDFGAARELMRRFLVPRAGEPSLSSGSDELRLGLRCAAALVKRLEETRFAQ